MFEKLKRCNLTKLRPKINLCSVLDVVRVEREMLILEEQYWKQCTDSWGPVTHRLVGLRAGTLF